MDRANGSTDLLDMAFVSPNLAKHDIQFQIGGDLGSDHLPFEISVDAPPHRNLHTNHTKYKFDQTDRKVFESTLLRKVLRTFLDLHPLVTRISMLTLSYLQLALQSIKPFQSPKACELRVTPFLKKH